MRVRRRRLPMRCDSAAGISTTELLIVLTMVVLVTALAVPATGRVIETNRGRQAAAFVAARLRSAQQAAALTTRAVAVVFDASADGWTLRVCEDGNRNGLRRAELPPGPDRCLAGPFDVAAMFPGVRVAVDAALRGPEGEDPSPDPVRFGRGNLASFSPAGSGTTGSVFLRAPGGQHYLVRVSGVTGRVRVFRHDPVTGWETL
jgi:type II secretory pathway pseudopilin PulG